METTSSAGKQSPLPRLLRVVYRVKDLDQSVQFYTECFGMRMLGRYDSPLEKYEVAIVGYGPTTTHFVLELRFYFEMVDFKVGTGFGHIGINVENVYKSLESIKSKGGKVTKDALQVKGASTICAFVEDPNGYEIELLQRLSFGDPLCQVMLRVVDLQRTMNFYEKSFGMRTLRTFELEIPQMKFQLAFMGFGPEDRTTVLELNSIYNVATYDKGNAYLKLVIGVDEIEKTYESINLADGLATKVVRENVIEALNVYDVEGWEMVVVDAKSKEAYL